MGEQDRHQGFPTETLIPMWVGTLGVLSSASFLQGLTSTTCCLWDSSWGAALPKEPLPGLASIRTASKAGLLQVCSLCLLWFHHSSRTVSTRIFCFGFLGLELRVSCQHMLPTFLLFVFLRQGLTSHKCSWPDFECPLILLPPPPKSQDYNDTPSCPAIF